MRRLAPRAVAALGALFLLIAPGSTGEYLRLEGHGGPVKATAIASGGEIVLTGSFDNSIGVWSLVTGENLGWLEGHEAAVTSVEPFGEGHAVSGGDDFAVIHWDIESGQALNRFEGHRGKVVAVAADPAGRWLASASWDGRVGLWDAASGESLGFLEAGSPVNDVLFVSAGRQLLSAGQDGSIKRWNVGDASLDGIVHLNGFGVTRMLADEAAGWLLFGSINGGVRVMSLDGFEPIADLTRDDVPVWALSRSPDGSRVAVGDSAGFVHVVDVDGWETDSGFRAVLGGPVWALSLSEEGDRLVTGSLNDHVDVWPLDAPPTLSVLVAGATAADETRMSNGERQFAKRCAVCHALGKGPSRRAGPTLHGVFGRRVGGLEGYNYSAALAGGDFLWSAETIDDLFDLGPQQFVPGTKMPAQRIVNDKDRLDLIEYLARATVTE